MIDLSLAKSIFSSKTAVKLAAIIMQNGQKMASGEYVIKGDEVITFSPAKKEISVADAIWGYPRYVYGFVDYSGFQVYVQNVEGRMRSASISTIIKYICQNLGANKLSDFDDEGNKII